MDITALRRHSQSALLLTVAACLTGTTGLNAQSEERQMIVSVLDGDRVPVGDLAITDFEIHEDGATREVLRIGPAGADRQIALLVDTSTAATEVVLDFRKGLTAFVDGMYDGNQISLITFGGRPRVRVESTSSVERLRDAIGEVFALPGEAAYMLDAMSESAEGFARQDVARPIIVVLTTEGLDYSHARAREVFEHLDESGAAAYTLLLRGRPGGFGAGAGISQSQLQHQEMERDLVFARATDDSGGHHRELLVGTAIEGAMNDMVTELRNQYLVVYSRPDALIPPEEITVGVTRAGLTVRGIPLRTE